MPMKLYKYLCSLHLPPWERQVTFWLRISFSKGKKFERPGARQLGLCNMCLCRSKKESRHVCEACVHVNSCFPLMRKFSTSIVPRGKKRYTTDLQWSDHLICAYKCIYIYIYVLLCKFIHVCNYILLVCQSHYCITLSDLIFLRFQKLSLHAWCCTQPPCADSNAICSTISPSWPRKCWTNLVPLAAIGVGNKGHRERRKNCHLLSNSLHNFRQSSSTKLSCPNEDLLLSPSLHLHRASSLRITWWQCIDRPCFHCFG